MKKLRTINPIPGIPVGTVLEWNTATDSYLFNTPRNGPTRNGSTLAMQADILEGFVEEVKEQEEFWYLTHYGDIGHSKQVSTEVPNWLRFRTRESAEKFSNAMRKKVGLFPTVFQGVNDSYILVPRGSTNVAYDILSAINDRVK